MRPALLTLSLLGLPLATAAFGQAGSSTPTLLVSGYTSESVHRFATDGTPLGDLGSVPGAQSVRYGPDGRLYVCSETTHQVLRFDGVSGAPLGPFVWDDPATPEDDTGGLSTPTAAVFGPDGRLYVASFGNDQVLRYDGDTGAFVDVFIDAGEGLINGPDAGMDFGPDGHLYIPSFNNNRVLKYDGESGAPMGTFAPPGLLVLSRPRCLRWRGDGLMYVTSWGNGRVLRYDLDGELVDTFVNTPRPTGLAFGPQGDLYVASDQSDSVLRFDGTSGASLGAVVAGGGAIVDGATYVEFLPDPELRLGRPEPGVAGVVNSLSLRNATPGAPLFIAVGASTTSLPLVCPGAVLGVQVDAVFTLFADGQGEATLTATVGAGAAGLDVAVQAFDPAGACLSNLVLATFD